MKNFFLSLALLFLSTVVTIQAQVNTYTFSSSPGVYTEIAGDTTVAFATTTTTSGVLSMDDSQYPNNSLPFTFIFNGNAYDNVVITDNGFVTFGATLPGGTTYSAISSTTLYSGAIAGGSNDLIGNRGITATRTIGSDSLKAIPAAHFVGLEVGRILTGTGIPVGATVIEINPGLGFIRMSAVSTTNTTGTVLICSGSIVRGTTGSVGSRVHTIQFKGVRNWTTSANANSYNFQIKLYETTNRVEIVYGNYSVSSPASPQVGLRGASNADFNNRTTAAGWAASVAGTLNSSTATLSAVILPASGQIYAWTPFVLLSNDVGTTAILNPVNGGGSGIQAPSATIKNFGSATQGGYNVICTISPGGYSNTQVAPSLASGASANINFANVNLAPNVAYTVTVYTNLSNDQNRSNDTQKVVVTLLTANYGNDSGYFYANNLATDQPSFPEWCWKDTTGSISIVDSGVVKPGNTIVGGLDDGYFKLSLNDILLAFGIDPTNKYLKYNGVCYDSIFPGTNGIIGFTEAFGTYSLTDFNVDGAQVANNALLPIWHDANLATQPTGSRNRLSYKAQGNLLIITYDRAVSFSPTTDWVSYQVMIEIVTGTGCDNLNSNFKYTFADTTNGNTSASFLANYLAQYPAASGLVTTFRNYVSGYSQNGAPIVYGGYVSSANPFPAGPVTQVNVKRPLFNLTTGSGLAVEFGPDQLNLNQLTCSKKSPIRIAIALQGLQSNLIGSRVRDTVTINIREGSPAPYPVIQQYKVLLDSAYNGSYSYGYADLDFAWEQNHPYYIEVLHRQSVFSWSNIVSSSTDSLSYDFTTGVGKTYGNNAKLVNGAASFYTGDVVGGMLIDAQDGCVDLTDIIYVYNESSVFSAGPYVLGDLNYDGVVDLSDIVLVYNNANAFICGVKPPGADNTFVTANDSKLNFVPDASVIILPDPYREDKIDFNNNAVNAEKKVDAEQK